MDNEIKYIAIAEQSNKNVDDLGYQITWEEFKFTIKKRYVEKATKVDNIASEINATNFRISSKLQKTRKLSEEGNAYDCSYYQQVYCQTHSKFC